MIVIYPIGMLQGDHFSPAEAERRTGITLSKKNEPGEIGKRGRYIGKPIPYGSAEVALVDPKEDIPGNLIFENPLIQTLIQHHATFRACGATDIYIYMAVGYQDQCNMAFDAKLMKTLGECDIELWVSCYEKEEENICDAIVDEST